MDYPRIYNAAADMVDRNVAQGRAAKTGFIDPDETLTYGELQARTNRMANLLATYGIPRESRVALLLLDTRRFPGRVLGRHQGRRGAGVPQHAADGGAVRLHPRRQPRQGAVRVCAAAAGRAADPGSAAVPQARLRVGRRSRLPSRCSLRGELGFQQAETHTRRHLRGRDGLLALLVGLHRHAQRRAPRAFEPDGDGAADRTGLPRHARGRCHLFGRQAVLRLRPRQFHVVSRCRSARPRAAARAADAGSGVPHAQAISADHVLRRADALCRDAGLSAGHARQQLAAAAPMRFGRRGPAGRHRQGLPRQVRRRRAGRRGLDRDAAPVRVQQSRAT